MLSWFKGVCILLFLTGCATTSRLSVLSYPANAKIYAKPVGAGELKYIGVTPLTVENKTLDKEYGGSGPIYIEIEKGGYFPYRIYVTDISLLNTQINVQLTPQTGLEDQTTINWVVESLFDVQRLTKYGRYDAALRKLNQIQDKVPNISCIYEMKGGIYYLQAQYRAAYYNYARAVLYNPKNVDARHMRDLLGHHLNITVTQDPMDLEVDRMPASATPASSTGTTGATGTTGTTGATNGANE